MEGEESGDFGVDFGVDFAIDMRNKWNNLSLQILS